MANGFLGHFGFTKFFFKLTVKNQAFKAMVEPRDENPLTKVVASAYDKQFVSGSFL
jgi:hypothetical protein